MPIAGDTSPFLVPTNYESTLTPVQETVIDAYTCLCEVNGVYSEAQLFFLNLQNVPFIVGNVLFLCSVIFSKSIIDFSYTTDVWLPLLCCILLYYLQNVAHIKSSEKLYPKLISHLIKCSEYATRVPTFGAVEVKPPNSVKGLTVSQLYLACHLNRHQSLS